MKLKNHLTKGFMIVLICIAMFNTNIMAQNYPAIKTPLKQELLTLLTNEISGQTIFNNKVILAGAPWVRNEKEFSTTFYESKRLYEMTKEYGIKNVELLKYSAERQFTYPFEGEFWVTSPEKRLIAKLGADAALVAGGSVTADLSGELIYIPQLTPDEIDKMIADGKQEKYNGKIALLWSHARGKLATALDAAGIQAVVSFSSRDRYYDPNQVVYGSGSYGQGENLKIGFSVSWRQWSELMEDVETGKKLTVRCKTRIEKYDSRYEIVHAWIPGTEPDKEGVIFTAHLFEGYTKRGANDNMGGCVVQLEILRALTKLIETGQIPQPKRNIYFIWPNEISGTYEFLKKHPGLPEKLSININMDMVTEGLRLNNAVMTMSECPDHLPSYFDGLAKSIFNYVWRTNDIVYLPGAPRGRRGGQYFPIPMMEKNGSLDAFRFFIHKSTGGSDHICFKNSSVNVPAIEFFTWPDYWYHADTDMPSKSDPTQMKRIAFIGAATAYASANCTDDVLEGLLDETANYGYLRIAERDLPRALKLIETANANNLGSATSKALSLGSFFVNREVEAIESTYDICSGSAKAKKMINNRVEQMKLYDKSIQDQLIGYAKVKAKELNVKKLDLNKPDPDEKKYSSLIPVLHPDVRGQEFSISRHEKYTKFVSENKNHPGLKIANNRNASRSVLNYINGKRSISKITHCAEGETLSRLSIKDVAAYFDLLKAAEWVE
ncbi:M28 family peptidase [Bacteroidota bacterium]